MKMVKRLEHTQLIQQQELSHSNQTKTSQAHQIHAKVVAKDTNGTKVETTYTPTVTPVTPTAEPKETTGKQGQPQTQDTESMFKQGDEVAPIDKTTVKLVDPSGNEVTTMPALKRW